MSIKITRDHHAVLFFGFAAWLFMGGVLSLDFWHDTTIAITWLLAPSALWVLGWFVFHLTRPEK